MQTKFLTRREAARYLTEVRGLPTSWRTLQKLACIGGGPIYQRYGIQSVYTQDNLDTWADAKVSAPRRSTSEAA
jgi:hypothetical protein